MSTQFKRKYFLLKLSYTLLFIIVINTFALIGTIKHGISLEGIIVLSLYDLFFGLLFIKIFLHESDIIIDDQSISRSFLGKVWRRIKWQDVKRVRIARFRAMGNGSKLFTYIYIFTSDKWRALGLEKGNMALSTEVENAQNLVGFINQQILKYKIPVEAKRDGEPPQKIEKIVLETDPAD